MARDKQHDVVRDATLTFANILKRHISPKLEKPIEVVFEFPDEKVVEKAEKDGSVLISVVLVDTTRETGRQNMEEPVIREEDENGDIVEYKLGIPTYVKPRYLFTPWNKDPLFCQSVTGVLLQYFFDNPSVAPEDIAGDSLDGNERPPITFEEKFKVEEQLRLWQAMARPFRPSLVYTMAVRLDSTKRNVLRRVKERILDYRKLQG
jgi:hypothetical protein